TLRVTFVSDRTTIAAASRTSGNSSASESRFSSTVTLNSDRCCNRAIPFGETGSQINTFINRGRTLVWCLRNSYTFVALELAWGKALVISETPHYSGAWGLVFGVSLSGGSKTEMRRASDWLPLFICP